MTQLLRSRPGLEESLTTAIFRRAVELQSSGIDVVTLSVGEPPGGPPSHVLERVAQALAAGPSRYAPVQGLAGLREAVALDCARTRGVTVDPQQVLISAGAKHALFNLTQVLLGPGDRVLIPTPAWGTYGAQVRLAGAVPVPLPTTAELGYRLPLEAIRSELSAGARAILLCSPNNPTGTVYSETELRALAELVADSPCFVITDEIYGGLTYAGARHHSLLSLAPELQDRMAVVDGVSKRYAMTGYRIGWSIAPPEVTRACVALQSQVSTAAATLCQQAAEAALRGPQEGVADLRRRLETSRQALLEGLSALPGVHCVAPAGAFYVLADVRERLAKPVAGRRLADDLELGYFLLEEARVAVVPGSAFGAPGTLRFSFSVERETLERGVSRVARLLG